MKKILAITLCVATLLLSFTSCKKKNVVPEEGDVTIVVENSDGDFEVYKTYLKDVENRHEGALGILQSLRHRANNPLHLEYSTSYLGAYIVEIGSIKEDPASNAYVIAYTSTETDSYYGAPTVDFEGARLFASGVGVSLMTIEAGSVILFRLETYAS